MSKKLLLIVDVVLVIAFVVVAVIYWTHAADRLPTWFPGYSASDGAVHFKHGLGAIIVALALAAYGWFLTGPKDSGSNPGSGSVPKQ
jgi:hypothetical protein